VEWRGEERRGEERRGEERRGKEWSGVEWSEEERRGEERKGVEWSGVEWSGVERRGRKYCKLPNNLKEILTYIVCVVKTVLSTLKRTESSVRTIRRHFTVWRERSYLAHILPRVLVDENSKLQYRYHCTT
jgi:hypothetical protein